MKQLPILPPSVYDFPLKWSNTADVKSWLTPRILELTYTAWDLEPFARDLGYDGPPFRWDPERRFLLRCEMDAAFFHLYGIERDDVNYIMETFPIVKRKDEAAHGEYLTKRVILETYDKMARAAEIGESYRTPLDPPPVDLGLEQDSANPALTRPQIGAEPREQSYPASRATREKTSHGRDANMDANVPATNKLRNREDPILESPEFSNYPNEHWGNAEKPSPDRNTDPPQDATLFPASDVEINTAVPSLEEAALALHSCVPDREKVQRDGLLLDAARELGHTQLTKRVRSVLNKALSVERNKGRLKTDWKVVWKPRRT